MSNITSEQETLVLNNMDVMRDYAQEHSLPMSLGSFYEQVRNGGPWDYKQLNKADTELRADIVSEDSKYQKSYEYLGNFNYGAAGTAAGFSEQFLLRMAGLAQGKAGTSQNDFGHCYWRPPYGDDPNDQKAIKDGIEFAKSHGFPSNSPIDAIGDAIDSAKNIEELLNHIDELYQDLADIINRGGVNPEANDFFKATKNWTPPRDPLVLDLDGDGIETVGTNSQAPIYFDHDGNGIKESTSWVKADDGFLVLDRNSNGWIDNGAELFGEHTVLANGAFAKDGFAALADLDSNHDGKIDSQDARFAELRVWQDVNQDGISQASELHSLDSLGIAALNLAYSNTVQALGNGNQLAELGSYSKTDGSTATLASGQLADINLAVDTFHRQYTTSLDTASVSALPDMTGSGQVRDLREAA